MKKIIFTLTISIVFISANLYSQITDQEFFNSALIELENITRDTINSYIQTSKDYNPNDNNVLSIATSCIFSFNSKTEQGYYDCSIKNIFTQRPFESDETKVFTTTKNRQQMSSMKSNKKNSYTLLYSLDNFTVTRVTYSTKISFTEKRMSYKENFNNASEESYFVEVYDKDHNKIDFSDRKKYMKNLKKLKETSDIKSYKRFDKNANEIPLDQSLYINRELFINNVEETLDQSYEMLNRFFNQK